MTGLTEQRLKEIVVAFNNRPISKIPLLVVPNKIYKMLMQARPRYRAKRKWMRGSR